MEYHPASGSYIVTGAAGHLGSTILRLLADTPARVSALILPQEQPIVVADNIHYVHGDVRDPATLQTLMDYFPDGTAAVIHAAALISIARKMPPLLREVNVEGTEHMLKAAMEHHVRRYIQVSSVHAIPPLPNQEVMTEISDYDPDLVSGGYAKTKAEAARKVLAAAGRGLNAAIVLPSGILGPYDCGHNHLSQMIADYLHGRLPACVDGGYDFVDVRDAAAGCLAAADAKYSSASYLLTGHYACIRDLLQTAGEIAGRRPVPVIPASIARMAVPVIEQTARLSGHRPLYTEYSLETLAVNSRFSSALAERELGYSSRPLQQTLADMICWLRSREAARQKEH
jgi:dihydroflavonol-4-reductase